MNGNAFPRLSVWRMVLDGGIKVEPVPEKWAAGVEEHAVNTRIDAAT